MTKFWGYFSFFSDVWANQRAGELCGEKAILANETKELTARLAAIDSQRKDSESQLDEVSAFVLFSRQFLKKWV